MHVQSLLFTASAALVSLASAGQVNFYSDTNCQNYIGSSYPGGNNQIVGGPAGSFSALWVTADQTQCSGTCGPLNICGDSGCNRRRATGFYKCVSFDTGVWARNGCGFDCCTNARKRDIARRELEAVVRVDREKIIKRGEDGAPDWKREAGSPDWKREAGSPDWKREAGSPDWKREAGSPDWKREAGSPDWKREAGSPDWKREAGEEREDGSPDW